MVFKSVHLLGAQASKFSKQISNSVLLKNENVDESIKKNEVVLTEYSCKRRNYTSTLNV